MGVVLWFAGLIGLIVAAAVASSRGRASPNEVIGRGGVAAAAVTYAALVGSAIWLWGGQHARDGRAARLHEGATVAVTIEGARVAIEGATIAPRVVTIGHGASTTVRVPGDGSDELARVEIDERGHAVVRVAAGDNSTAPVRLLAVTGELARTSIARSCVTASSAAFDLPMHASIAVIQCDGDRERGAVVVRREPTGIVVVPASIARGRLAPERRTLRAGDALRIGGGADAIPGLVTWEVAAPNGVASMLAIPLDPTDCSAWSVESSKARVSTDEAGRSAQGCLVDAGAFSLAAVPFVPDTTAVIERAGLAVLVIGAPVLLLLFVLGASPRRARSVRVLGRALRLCVLAGGLAALACWRLLWAHRIDASDPGARVDANLLAVIAVGATLAGNAVLALDALDSRSWLRRAMLAALAWAAWLTGSVLVTGIEPPATPTGIAVIGLSAIAALAPVIGDVAGRFRAPPEIGLLAVALAAVIARGVGARGALVKLGLAYATVLLGHAALRTLLATRRAPEVGQPLGEERADVEAAPSGSKAELAGDQRASSSADDLALPAARWRVALGRIAFVPAGWWRGAMRGALLLGSLLAAVGALAALDAGVTLAITGVGLALAMLVAGHDAIYDAAHAGKLGVLEREHARLLSAHGVAVGGLAVGIGACAVIASDRELLENGALAMLDAPLVVAGLFGLAALIARTHRRSWVPWLAAALAALAVWGMREVIVERATAGDNVASRRVAAVVEPGYALLRDDHAFVANASAWREASASSVGAWRGQGYFGAAIRDPGVARSVDNDYLPVLVVRETGVAGLLQSVLLMLALVIGAGAIANVRLRHASREQRARWLVTGVAGVLAVYQPLAALGILPLTGLTWPGLGIDSPGDLWLFVIGAVWCLQGAETGTVDRHELRTDERVRRAPRLARARRIVMVSLVACGLAAVVLVVRAGICALSRANDDDGRVAAALEYASSLSCIAPDADMPSLDDAIPMVVAGRPTDGATARYERELHGVWRAQRAVLLRALGEEAAAKPADPIPASVEDLDDLDASDPWLGAPRKARPTAATTKRRRSVDPSTRDARGTRPAKPGGTARSSRTAKASGTAKGVDAKSDAAVSDQDSDDSGVLGRLLRMVGIEGRVVPELMPCPARAGAWRLTRDGEGCTATLSLGWPDVELSVRMTETGVRAACAIALPDDAVSTLRAKARVERPRIRLVSAPIGASADDAGELVLGGRIVRLRSGAPAIEFVSAARGVTVASEVRLDDVVVALRPSPRGVVLRGRAELFVAEPTRANLFRAAWRRMSHADGVVLDRVTLIVAGSAERRVVALFRPPRAWANGATSVDSLLADAAGDRAHRIYPHGAAIPELGWVNPFDVARSLGLDGWVHAFAAETAHGAPACGTLAPPPIGEDQTCTRSPLDGVLECRVALQPQLARELRALAGRILASPKSFTGRDTLPVRVGYVALRGDTGEILAQGNLAAGRPALAYAPADARAEAELVRLRDEPGEADAERVDWNLPIAVGSTFKPILARAAEQAFPRQIGELSLTAAGHAEGCRRRRGSVAPIAGHCPPTSVAGSPTTADVHEFLAKSPNWFQAALGIVGLALPDAKLAVKDREVTFAEVVGSDLATWPADSALTIADASGPILSTRGLSIAGLRRTPMWTRVEALLGRPMCTLGDRASCERAAVRADVCAARALPVARPGPDLRNLVALGPDRIDPYPGDRSAQTSVPVREYFQLLRGSGVHAIGSLAQITDAFGRVIYEPAGGTGRLAASWFPAPVVGTVPTWSCVAGAGRETTVLGADGGLCGVVRTGGTAHAGLKEVLADSKLVIYGAKTGTIDSLADLARSPRACARWNAAHVAAARLECGKAPPDDSLFVIAFGVVTPRGTIPITLGIQLQRAGKSAATRATPAFIQAIAHYLRG